MKVDHLKNRRQRSTYGRGEVADLRPTLEPSHSGRVSYDPSTEAQDTEALSLRKQETPAETVPAPTEAPKTPRPPRRPPKALPAPEAKSRPVEKPPTVYLDHSHIDFAYEVTRAATLLRPRMSISAAAVVRYALDELCGAMAPQEALDAIVAMAGAEKTEVQPGEKRPRITAYVNSAHRQYVDDVVYAARSARIRNINASTVYRFAMDQLQGSMSAEQVRDAIATKPTDSKATGRKRR